ncbi:probable oxidoreductase (aldo-keto reductase family protein) [Natronomonas moolapensis 8.8.11]|uniref:Probable oxidoreductase (Aldo-keto reductase family protein) n=2 Tax=Natronomonas moolapensis TaxID=416273 RepID=M1Y218_NATM8|nr:probable oxidoreductase (aldo-keto reductase family protein) [Natronomonas moolapensis 8.8.11]
MTQQALVPDRTGMPGLGLGTWQNEAPDTCAESVRTALEAGYRHVDTAQIYGNEAAVGRGIAAADIDREDVFLATKVWIDSLAHDDVLESTEESLEKLGTEYVDLLYVHWPAGEYEPEATLSAFEQLRESGAIDRIGVSNFEPSHVETAQSVVDAPIFANQVEMHPLLPQRELRAFCADAGVELVAYSPLARGDVFDVDVLSDIADDRGVSEAQVSLAWLRAKDVTPIPKATGADHIRDNWASLELELTDEEVGRIDGIDAERRQVDPDFAPAAW